MLVRLIALVLMFALASVCVVAAVLAQDGLITKPSASPTTVTLDRLERALKERGFMIFARLDHAAAADTMGLKMRSRP